MLFPAPPNLVAGLVIVRPDQVWVSDVTSIRLQNSFVYLAVIMDVFTPAIRWWQLEQELDQSLTRLALQRVLAQHTPEIPHSDQGVQYVATAYTQALDEAYIQIRLAEVSEGWQDGDVERFMRTVKEEEVQLAEYDEVYRPKRVRSALDYLTPAEFEEQWHRVHVQTRDVQHVYLKSGPILGVHFTSW